MTYPKLKVDQQCPVCSKGKLLLRKTRKNHRKQKFLGCSTYPKCKATFTGIKASPAPNIGCPICSGKMQTKYSFKTQEIFWSCIKYPKCNGSCPPKTVRGRAPVGMNRCPKCDEGVMIHRNSSYGGFGGCSNYPECTFISKTKKCVAPSKYRSFIRQKAC